MESLSHFESVIASLGDNSQKKGRRFEDVVKWWLTTDAIWMHEFRPETVLLWQESPYRTGPDIGIDLTAEDRFGNIWAIQAKNWKADIPIPKAEVDKFLTASNTKVFSHRLLVTTTNEISSNARRAIQDQEKPCTVVVRTQLEESDAWSRFGEQGNGIPSETKALRSHQQAAVSAVVSSLAVGGRGQLIMACGSGKTLTAQRIDEELNTNCTLVLLPSLLLVQQTLQSWRREANTEFKSLTVCSDSSVDSDEPIEKASDLPFPVTTDSEVIQNFLTTSGKKVIFSTYQSSERVKDAISSVQQKFDLVICDEAHRLAGAVDKSFGTVLKEGALPSKRYLFMTATPRVFTSRLKKAAFEDDVEINSMDDENKFGPVLHTFSFAEAIESKILTDYKVVIMGVEDKDIHDLIQSKRFLDVHGRTMDAALVASHYGVAKAMNDFGIRRVISFHSRVSKAREFASLHPSIHSEVSDKKSLAIYSGFISGKDSAFRRKALLDRLKKLDGFDFGLIGNARCLTEGVDVPSLDGIAFVDPRSSQVDIVQAVGRAIRQGGDEKSLGYIIIPIFFTEDQIGEEIIDESQFRPVWEVLNALKSHDTRLQEAIDSIRRGLPASEGSLSMPPQIIFDLPIKISVSFADKIQAVLIEKTSSVWDEWLGKLEIFQAANGHARPKRQLASDQEIALGSWVQHQRTLYNKNRLSPSKIEKLESIPTWTWDPFATQWQEYFERLENYVQTRGTSRVPSTFRDSSGKPLGKWIAKLRAKRETLDETQVRQLESLPAWTWSPFDEQWDEAMNEFEELSIAQGHTTFSRKDKFSDGRSMGGWVIKQRQSFEILSQEQKERLEALPGWSWNPFEDLWVQTAAQLESFVQEFGHSRVPQSYESPDGFKLGQVVDRIRNDFRKGVLAETRRIFVTNLPGWHWEPKKEIWEARYKLLLQFVEENHRIPRGDEVYSNEKLGWWVGLQRTYRKNGILEPEKQKKLEAVFGWTWNPNEDSWNKAFEELQAFCSANKRLPFDKEQSPSGLRLGTWVYAQRKRFDKLTPEQQSKLNSIPEFTQKGVPITADQIWRRNIESLSKFINSYGRTPRANAKDIDPGERSLGRWFIRQYRNIDNLDEIKRNELLKIDGLQPPIDSQTAWNEKLLLLKEEINLKGRVPPLRVSGREDPLGGWIRRQKRNWAKLSREQQRELISVPEIRAFLEI